MKRSLHGIIFSVIGATIIVCVAASCGLDPLNASILLTLGFGLGIIFCMLDDQPQRSNQNQIVVTQDGNTIHVQSGGSINIQTVSREQ